jgi:branched-chain amino acid transport system substrate-binding protein
MQKGVIIGREYQGLVWNEIKRNLERSPKRVFEGGFEMWKRGLPKLMAGISLIAVLTMLASLAACGPAATVAPVATEAPAPTKAPAPTAVPLPEAPATIKIGAVIDVTGPLQAFGAEFQWAFKYAEKVINDAGGVYVKEYDKKIPIEMLYGDHGADEQKAVTEMEYLASQGVNVFTGSTAIMPLGQVVAEKVGIPIVVANGSTTGPFAQGMKYVFSLSWMNNEMATWPFMLSAYLDPAWTPVYGFMEEQNLMGIDYGYYFRQECITRQANCVIQGYQRFGGDFSSQILAFKDAGVDFVYAPMIGPDGMKFWSQMKELNFAPKADLQLIAPADRRSWVSMGPDANYVITTNDYHWATGYAGAADFDAAYAADHNGEHATELAGDGYAAIQVIVDAIGRAGTLAPDKLRDAIAATNMETIKGPIAFNANGTPIRPYFAVQFIGGVEKIIYPAEMKEVDPVFPFPAWTDPNR